MTLRTSLEMCTARRLVKIFYDDQFYIIGKPELLRDKLDSNTLDCPVFRIDAIDNCIILCMDGDPFE